jgi:RNA polymerase sigma factor (sigma-70 family)
MLSKNDLTDQECNSAIADLIAGVPGVEEKLILGNTWLAEVWAIRICKRFRVAPIHYQDFTAQAYLILVESIKRVASGKTQLTDGNIRGYLVRRLRGHLKNHLSSMDVVPVPFRTICDWRQKKKLGRQHERTVNLTKTVIDLCKKDEEPDAAMSLEDTQSLLRKVVHNDPLLEQIVALRVEGKTDKEIGVLLGYTQQGISNLRAKIATRLKAELER